MRIVEIVHGSAAYQEVVSLRDEVLRRPLGLRFSAEQLDAERDSIHLAAYNDEPRLVGCLLLTPAEGGEIKMRQVAVRASEQRAGIGAAMVVFSERLARERGFSTMVLSAREAAIPFYLKLGYTPVGERFEEVTLPHQKMYKRIVGQ